MNVDYVPHAELRPKVGASGAWLAPILIFIGSGLLYLIHLDRLPHPDELYHILAARGLLEHGEPRIAEGLYTRVYLYTWLIAQVFAGLGESLSTARLPSLVAMAVVNALLFIWLRREANQLAAWLGAGLFVISPFALETAQFTRFYALQTLAFFLGCWATYAATAPDRRLVRRLGFGLAALLCLGFALYLQTTTLLGVAGLGLWLALVLGVPWFLDTTVRRHHKIAAGLVGLAVVIAALSAILASGLAPVLWSFYRTVPLFNLASVNQFWYYHFFNVIYYPTLWPPLGFLCLAALATFPRPAFFAMVIFAAGFLLNSFAGPKALRYVVYAQPFLFILFGLGLAALWPWLMRLVGDCRARLEERLTAARLEVPGLVSALIWGGLAFALLSNAAFLRTATQLADIVVPPEMQPVRWPEGRPLVEPLLSEVDVVVTMAELETLYFWERYDILFSPSRMGELAEQVEFAADFRTGRPVVTGAESLRRIFDCTSSGLFISNTHRWRRTNFIDAETADFIEREMTRLDLPARTQLIVFAWDHAPPAESDGECATIHEPHRGTDG